MRAARRFGLAAPRLPLVAGGSGELGRHFLEALADAGCPAVRVLDVKPPPVQPRGLEVDFRHHRLGAASAARLAEHLDGVDCVFNLVTADVRHATADEVLRTNVNGVRELIEGGKEASVGRFVHVSCTAITDHEKPSVEQSEEDRLPRLDDYSTQFGRAHREAEDAVLNASTSDFACVALRSGSIISSPWDSTIGPMLEHPGSVLSLEDSALVDFVAARDVCRAALLAADRLDSPAIAGQAIYVTKGEATRPHEVAALLAQGLGWNLALLPEFFQTTAGFGMDVRRAAMQLFGQAVPCVAPKDLLLRARVEKTFDNSRARHVLGYEAEVSVAEAVRGVVADYRRRYPDPKGHAE